jgi:hypothetical protein
MRFVNRLIYIGLVGLSSAFCANGPATKPSDEQSEQSPEKRDWNSITIQRVLGSLTQWNRASPGKDIALITQSVRPTAAHPAPHLCVLR